jgi:hypothetical protein
VNARRFRLVLVLAVCVLAALVWERPGDRRLFPAAPGAATVDVWIVDNGLHTDLVLPTAPLRGRSGPTATALAGLPPADWVAAGWGDWRFYRGTGLGPRRLVDGLRALFWPGNRSVVMLAPLPGAPEDVYVVRPIRLRLSQAGFERLAARLDRAFAGETPRLAAGPQPGTARFYEGRETFSILKVCNHWTADLLHAAGVPTRPVLSTVGAGLAWDLRARAGPQG